MLTTKKKKKKVITFVSPLTFHTNSFYREGDQRHLCVCVCVCTHAHGQVCPTLCNPVDGSQLVPSVHGILQARTLEWVAISSSRRSSWRRDQTHIQHVQRHRASRRPSWDTKRLEASVQSQRSSPTSTGAPPGLCHHEGHWQTPKLNILPLSQGRQGRGVLNQLCELMGSEGPISIILPYPCLIQEVVLK